MDFERTTQALRLGIAQGLPGIEAQYQMAPFGRRPPRELSPHIPNTKRAGVLALFAPQDGQAHLHLIRRTAAPGVHGGQISFPGGKLEEADQSLLRTAERETLEEIGVGADRYQVLGGLSPLYIPPSNYWVQPYLALASHSLPLRPEPLEVAEILVLPWSEFLRPEARQMVLRRGRKVPAFVIGEQEIWGATAMMIAELLAFFIPPR